MYIYPSHHFLCQEVFHDSFSGVVAGAADNPDNLPETTLTKSQK
jgi:hypothetical protein